MKNLKSLKKLNISNVSRTFDEIFDIMPSTVIDEVVCSCYTFTEARYNEFKKYNNEKIKFEFWDNISFYLD